MPPLFAFLSASREELTDMHRALLRQFVIESSLRKEQGLEPVERPTSLAKLEQLLEITDEQAHILSHQMEDELWEYSWYTYTDEWAWFRAKQEVTKQLGKTARAKDSDQVDTLVEAQYEASFERYAAEIDMQTEVPLNEVQPKRTRAPKKK